MWVIVAVSADYRDSLGRCRVVTSSSSSHTGHTAIVLEINPQFSLSACFKVLHRALLFCHDKEYLEATSKVSRTCREHAKVTQSQTWSPRLHSLEPTNGSGSWILWSSTKSPGAKEIAHYWTDFVIKQDYCQAPEPLSVSRVIVRSRGPEWNSSAMP